MTTPQILQPIPPGDGSGGVLPSSFVIGDILYADSTSTLKSLADVAVGSVLVSGGVGAAPAWSATSNSKFGSVAIGGATIGTDALAVTGTTTLAGTLTVSVGNISTPNVVIGQNIQAGSSGNIAFNGRTQMLCSADGNVYWRNNSATTLFDFGVTTASTLTVPSMTVTSVLKVPGAAVAALTSAASFTSGAGAGAGTLTNAPTSGNPTSWIKIVDNGTTRYIPAW